MSGASDFDVIADKIFSSFAAYCDKKFKEARQEIYDEGLKHHHYQHQDSAEGIRVLTAKVIELEEQLQVALDRLEICEFNATRALNLIGGPR